MKLLRLEQRHAPVIATLSGLQEQAAYEEKLTRRATRAEETGRKQR